MFWCLITPAILFATLGMLSLTFDVGRIRLPRFSLCWLLRGCLSSVFLVIAAGLVGLAYLTH
ncbi:hypothetical protein [Candidatus Viridilinea mediisalina]|uniref:Uncharacterized protein n=1 Tax=Candidatus Viridilinea mediisalina TaxID=2024553 RepID=A0A2A6RMJ8_9CHLR|nr:hypothetical protein [Candidatus Viridilinea mediisalina]PDW04080.1 hypothetical protein CJ255_05150 [Candidatus Viridilinea mediisalina]